MRTKVIAKILNNCYNLPRNDYKDILDVLFSCENFTEFEGSFL